MHTMTLTLNRVALACALTLPLLACNGSNDSSAPKADPVATRAALLTVMQEAVTQSAQLDPYGFAIDADSIAARQRLDQSLLDRLKGLDPSVLGERDRLFYDMISWDLSLAIEGASLPQSQIPIHHFRNRVADLAGDVGEGPQQGRRAAPRTASGFDYFDDTTPAQLAVTEARWRQDLDRHDRPAPQAMARSAGDPAAWYQEHLTWLKAYDTYLVEVKHQFELGSARGNTLPDELVDRVVKQLSSKLEGDQLSGLYDGWSAMPAEIDSTLREEYKGGLERINQHFVALRDYLDYRNGGAYGVRIGSGECDDGFCGMTDGRNWYRWLLKKHTTTTMTPEEVHKLGLGEVERIFGSMVQVCHTVGKCASSDVAAAKQSGEIYAFFRYLNQPGFFYQNPYEAWSASVNPDNPGSSLSEARQAALAEHNRALAEYNRFKEKAALVLPDFFDAEKTIPRLDYEVVPVSYDEAPYGGVAWYQDGNPQTGRKGQFFLNTFYPFGLQSWNISTLLAHEAAPGHHFQITIAQELAAKDPDFPAYVANSHYTAYAEGWALYTEYLADHDMGLYQGRGLFDPAKGDPKVEGSEAFNNQLQYFGRLNEEMLRAMRLVVDTGLHWYGWSHDRAVQYMKENSALGDGDVGSEVPRYMAYTGQATSYKAGQLTLLRMRAAAEEALGSRFDLKGFHHHVLEYGMLPMSVLEQKNAQWIKAQE
ncbi:DUF885 domain-containing protein [Aeromonas schubertii]|uniref:DUF885 domain-containing protein n=1 Tax=Aeromonas schubertii TaxID=652 RepID=UPI0010A7B0FF|nr:DUF885 domain-containing protein [Aeromonas schubertii]QCG49497.1 DUF885 domain-containing protein [Aeromonas schubertii]